MWHSCCPAQMAEPRSPLGRLWSGSRPLRGLEECVPRREVAARLSQPCWEQSAPWTPVSAVGDTQSRPLPSQLSGGTPLQPWASRPPEPGYKKGLKIALSQGETRKRWATPEVPDTEAMLDDCPLRPVQSLPAHGRTQKAGTAKQGTGRRWPSAWWERSLTGSQVGHLLWPPGLQNNCGRALLLRSRPVCSVCGISKNAVTRTVHEPKATGMCSFI